MKKLLLFALLLLAAGLQSMRAQEAYAVYTPNNTTLTFYYDTERSSRTGTTYDLNTGVNDPAWYTDDTKASVTRVVFNSSFANARPKSTYDWFARMESLKSITGMEYLNTSEVTNMGYMFFYCSFLTSLDLSHFNTSKVTHMNYMFGYSSALTSLDLSHFNTANVEELHGMFAYCIGLTSLDLSSFNTSKVTNMSFMFQECPNLKTIYAGDDWSTDAVTDSYLMFSSCQSLVGGQGTAYDENHNDASYAHIDGGTSNPGYLTEKEIVKEAYAYLTTSNATLTFYCDTERSNRKITKYDRTFDINSGYNWQAYSELIWNVVFDPSFAAARPTSTNRWFYGLDHIESITGLEYLNTSEVNNMSEMFALCPALTSIDLSHFNTSNCISMYHMFYGCGGLTSLDLSSFDTRRCSDMRKMFADCTNLETIYSGPYWSIQQVVYGSDMFQGCTSLVGGRGTTYDENHVDITYAHEDLGTTYPGYFTFKQLPEAYALLLPNNTTLAFYYDTQRSSRMGTSYDLNEGQNLPAWYTDGTYAQITRVHFDASFKNAHPTTTSYWFMGMSKLESISRLEYLNTNWVTDMRSMFYGCSSLTSLDISHFNTANVTNMSALFSVCSSLKSLDLSRFNTSQVTNMNSMFNGCSSITILDLSSFNTSKVTDMTSLFMNCNNLETIYVGSGWRTERVKYGSYMFKNCSDLVGSLGTTYNANHEDASYAHIDGGESNPGYLSFKYFEKDGIYYAHVDGKNVEVTYADESYNSYSGEVTIPATVEYQGTSYNVTSIGKSAFRDCSGLTKVSIPVSVTRIGNYAFANCPALQEIVCNAVTPPTIFSQTFTSYTPKLYVPRGTIEEYNRAIYWSFSNKFEIGTEYFEKDGIYYYVTGDNSVAVTYKNTYYNSYSGNVTIPETVTHNGNTYNVTAIGAHAFEGSTGLTGITIPNSVTTIGDKAFYGCKMLSDSQFLALTIPDAVTSIGYSAFYGCERISDVFLGSNITSIGDLAFAAINYMNMVTCYATTPPTIENTTFTRTTVSLYVPRISLSKYQADEYWKKFNYTRGITSFDFAKDGIYYQIQPDSNSVFVDRNYTEPIDDVVYYEAEKLNIPERVRYNGKTYTVKGVGYLAFWHSPNLRHISLPATITKIEDRAFERCEELTSIYLFATTPPTLNTALADYEQDFAVPISAYSTYSNTDVWSDVAGLCELDYHFEQDGLYYHIDGDKARVTYKDDWFNDDIYTKSYYEIPGKVNHEGTTYKVTEVSMSAFENCSNLTSVSIRENIETINPYAFANCTNLTRVTLPYGLKKIMGNAFRGCTNIQTIISNAFYPPTLNSNTFASYTAKLLVPHASKASYQSANYWKNFTDIEEFYSLDDALNIDFSGEISFESEGEYPWITVEEGDRIYAKSGSRTVTGSYPSILTAVVDIYEPSYLFFDFKSVPNQGGAYGFTMFGMYIDNDLVFFTTECNGDWETHSVFIPAGTHTLSWNFYNSLQGYHEGNSTVLGYSALDNVYITDEATGIEEIEGLTPALSSREGEWYDLQGRKLDKITQPGIYIRDGRKVLIK